MDRFSFFFGFYSLILGLAVAEILSGFAGYARERRIRDLAHRPAVFWLWQLPLKLTLCSLWLTLALVRSKRANLAVLAALIFLFCFPYWTNGGVPRWIHQHYDAPEVSAHRSR